MKAAGLLKYVWPFSGHHVLKGDFEESKNAIQCIDTSTQSNINDEAFLWK